MGRGQIPGGVIYLIKITFSLLLFIFAPDFISKDPAINILLKILLLLVVIIALLGDRGLDFAKSVIKKISRIRI